MDFEEKGYKSQYYLACKERLREIREEKNMYLGRMAIRGMMGKGISQSGWEKELARTIKDANELQVKIINLEKELDLRSK